MRAALLLLALAGCAHVPGLIPPTGTKEFPLQCISPCGAKLFAPPGVYKLDCADFIAAEARVLGAFASFEPKACSKLKGVIVSVQPTETWPDGWGRGPVAGISRCERRSLQVGPSLEVFPHEALHQFQCPAEDATHASWTPEMRSAVEAASWPRGVAR